MAILRDAPQVEVYTDGACSGNPGPGGYGVVLVLGEARKELSRGFRKTTNNRMEILAVIAGLEALTRPSKIKLTSDSRYVVDAVEKGWLQNWQRNGWKSAAKTPVANIDLWKRLIPALAKHDVRFEWVRGHTGHLENERVDQLAVAALRGSDREIDEGYETSG